MNHRPPLRTADGIWIYADIWRHIYLLTFMLSFRAVLNIKNKQYFVSAECRITNGHHKKNCRTSTHFQYLSPKFTLFWFWPQPISTHETGIQKWLYGPDCLIIYTYWHLKKLKYSSQRKNNLKKRESGEENLKESNF